MNKRKKFDKFAKRRLILLIIIILIIVLCISLSSRKNKTNYNNYRLLINDKYVNLQKDIHIDNFDNIYLSKQDISRIYDNNIYYDLAENLLITTFNKHIAILKLDNNIIKINGSEIELNASLIQIGEEIYLPFSELGIIYDFEYSFSKETKTIIVDSISKEKTEGTVAKRKVKIKKDPKFISANLDEVRKDEKVIILEDFNNYFKVRTENGNIGYINKGKVSDVKKIRENMDSSKISQIVFLEYNDISKDYSDMQIDKSKPNAVNIDAFTIKNKDLVFNIDTKSKSYNSYRQWAKENNIMIVAKLNCTDEVVEDFLTYNQRNEMIEKIYINLVKNNLTALNINFDKINDVNSYYRFLIELAPKLRESGIKIMVTYNKVLNEEKLETIVDYIIK